MNIRMNHSGTSISIVRYSYILFLASLGLHCYSLSLVSEKRGHSELQELFMLQRKGSRAPRALGA